MTSAETFAVKLLPKPRPTGAGAAGESGMLVPGMAGVGLCFTRLDRRSVMVKGFGRLEE